MAVPACRRRPGRRNTGLRTAATPRGVAKMLASGHRLRAWGEACDACIAGRTLRCARIGGGAMGAALGRRDGGDRANGANGANGWRCIGSAGSTPKWVQLIITRYNAVVPGWVDTPTKCVPKVRPSLLATPLATGAYLRHAPGKGGADPGTTAVVPGYDQCCRFAALRCSQRPLTL